MSKLYGIDVYSGEGPAIFSKVNVDFGIVKVSGNPPPYKWNYTNEHAAKQLKECYKLTGLVGCYHFTYGKARASKEAAFFVKQVKKLGYLNKAILVIDYEGPAINKGRKWIKAFAKAVTKKAGYKPIIYASGSVIAAQKLGDLGYKIWEASYPTNNIITGFNPPKGKVWYKDRLLWQFTEKGRLKGYSGNLDLDVFYGTKADWHQLAGMKKAASSKDEEKKKTEAKVTHMISNCGHDERNKYSGGKAGDQTGGEYKVIPWYNRPWNVVLRPATKEIGTMLAKIAKQAANNNAIGYDQGQRQTYFEELKKVKYHPEKIETKCEADCSSSTAANVIATGHRLDIKELKEVKADSWTGNLRARLKAAGFTPLISDKYTESPDYLLPGDILLNEAHHVAINISKGERAGSEQYGDQKNKEIAVDGWFGPECATATQLYFRTFEDGIISNQALSDKKYLPRAVTGTWHFKEKGYKGGSQVIKEVQKFVGMKEKERDGLCGKKTIKAWQRFLNVKATGKLDEATVKAWQKYLNAHRK